MSLESVAPPHSLHAEQSVIGGLMLDNDAIDRIGALNAESFYRHDHRLLFEAIRGLIAMQRPADVLTVHDRLSFSGKDQVAGGVAYLNDIASSTPSASNIGRYADIVREKALMRGLLSATNRVQEIVHESGRTASEMLDAAQNEIGKLAQTTIKKEPASIQEAMGRYVEGLDQRYHGAVENPAIPTGLKDLDALLNGGIRRGRSVTVGARPGMGKSAFAETIACHTSINGFSTLFLSLEMPEDEVTERAVANWGKVPTSALADPKSHMNESHWPGVTAAVQRATEAALFIDDTPALTLLDVVTKAPAVKRKRGLDLLVIDYLQLMVGLEEKRYQQIETITKGLKGLAKSLNIAVIALSQFSRDIEKRTSPHPKMSDFRDGGSIEQDSDILIGLYREEADKPDTEWKGCGELFVLKQRGGKIGKVMLTYLGEYTRFENFTGSMSAYETRSNKSKSRGFEG
ncbi:replicative DNA helicase [Alcaligenaceae bacterium A4P071]|nr:replicative DNA helicase [Alcaligenaceae bacterium A4P071]